MRNLILAVLVSHLQLALAQNPVANQNIAPNPHGFGRPEGGVFEDAEIGEDVKKFLFKDVERDRDGLIKIKSNSRYTRLIEDFSKNPRLKHEMPPELKQVSKQLAKFGYQYFGFVIEDKHRSTSIFKNGETGYLMYTNWKYQKAGASFSTAASFLNRTVDGVPAVLSLMSGGDGTAIWKCTWWKEGVSYEVYITDVMNAREVPTLTSDQAMEIAKQFVGTYK